MEKRIIIVLLAILTLGVASDFNMGGHVIFNEPRWEDMLFPASALLIPPGAAPFAVPDQVQFPIGTSNPTYSYAFDPSSDEGLLIPSVQTRHARKDGTDLHPHVHWSPTTTDTGTVVWVIVCSLLTDIGDTITGTFTATITDSGSGTANDHLIAENEDMSGAGTTISAMTSCAIYRDTSEDTYTGDAVLHDLDFHYEVDTPGGSKTESAK